MACPRANAGVHTAQRISASPRCSSSIVSGVKQMAVADDCSHKK